tara:strand:- start:243 stop:1022 length:780 start_codon:yes stop_codon:yes gene_type:complete
MRITSTGKVGIGTTSPGAKLEVEVADADDTGGILLDFDETGAYYGLEIDSEASNAALYSHGKFPGYFVQDISAGYGLSVLRDIAEAGSNPLVVFKEDNATGEQAVLRLVQDGTGNILELKDGGSTVFTVADGGAVTATGPASGSAAGPGSYLSVTDTGLLVLDEPHVGILPLTVETRGDGDAISAATGFCVVTAGNSTVTLSSPTAGKELAVKLSASVGYVTLNAAGGTTVENGNSILLESTGSAVQLIGQDTQSWWVV